MESSQHSAVRAVDVTWRGDQSKGRLRLCKVIELFYDICSQKRIKVDNYRARFSKSQFSIKGWGVNQFEFVSSSGKAKTYLSYPTLLHIGPPSFKSLKDSVKDFIIFPCLISWKISLR